MKSDWVTPYRSNATVSGTVPCLLQSPALATIHTDLFLDGTTALPGTRTANGNAEDWRSAVMAHRHIIGRSGSGKSTLAKQWAIHDIHKGHAVVYFDPHGTDTDELLQYIPAKRRKHTLIFDPTQYAIPWNPLASGNIPRAADTMATAIKYAFGFGDIPTARMYGVLYNSLAALMEAEQGLFGMYLLLESADYRTFVLDKMNDEVVKRYWSWYDTLPHKQQYEERSSTFNKVQVLMADPRIRAMAGTKSSFSVSDFVKDKILLVRLPQGELGVEKSKLLGSIMLAQVQQACLARDTTIPCSIYLDEVHTYAPNVTMELLSGIRKFNVDITAIHQYLDQVPRPLQSSLKANCTQYAFSVGIDDARFFPPVPPNDLQLYQLDPFHYIVFGDGKQHNGVTEPLPPSPYLASETQVRAHNQRNFVSPATKEVDALLKRF